MLEILLSLLDKVSQAGLAHLLVIDGLTFLLLGTIGKIGVYIDMSFVSRIFGISFGLILLIAGIVASTQPRYTQDRQTTSSSELSEESSEAVVQKQPSKLAGNQPEFEPNNSFANAQSVDLDQPVEGSLASDTDEDILFYDKPNKSTQYLVTISGAGAVSARIYNQDRATIRSFNKGKRLQSNQTVRISSSFYIGLSSLVPPVNYVIELKAQSG